MPGKDLLHSMFAEGASGAVAYVSAAPAIHHTRWARGCAWRAGCTTRRPMAGEERPSPARQDAAPKSADATEAQEAHDQQGSAVALHLAFELCDDATLIEHAKGNPEAFGVLYERYVRAVFAFAFSKTHDTALAEDITSQTFLQALRALPRYEQRG